MSLIIDRGGPSDPQALALQTRQRNWIHNELTPERAPIEMRAAIDICRGIGPDVRLRSASSHYNCMGMLFAARRTAIDIKYWDLIQHDDAYRRLHTGEAPTLGDVVVYRRPDGVQHVGMVIELVLRLNGVPSVIVLSQWGFNGEYRHPVDQVPALYGQPEYWTDRKSRP